MSNILALFIGLIGSLVGYIFIDFKKMVSIALKKHSEMMDRLDQILGKHEDKLDNHDVRIGKLEDHLNLK